MADRFSLRRPALGGDAPHVNGGENITWLLYGPVALAVNLMSDILVMNSQPILWDWLFYYQQKFEHTAR